MGQYANWDYKRPFYYMVTIKCRPGMPMLSKLDASSSYGIDMNYPLSRVVHDTIQAFYEKSPSVESIRPYAIMPNHIHLLIKIADIPERLSLKKLVFILKRQLTRAISEYFKMDMEPFEEKWHDHIITRKDQLGNCFHYIQNNPKMALLRRAHPDEFHCLRAYQHPRLGETPYDLVGNPELLDEPGLQAVQCSRSMDIASVEQQFHEWREGQTAVGVWYSPAEVRASEIILERGGNLIYLMPHGIGELWHPAGDEAHTLCAQGRLLFASPYPPSAAQLPQGETRARCLALNAVAAKMAAFLYEMKPTP